jgi:hypothetical protein
LPEPRDLVKGIKFGMFCTVMQPGHFGWSPVCLAILVKLRKASILIETVVAL